MPSKQVVRTLVGSVIKARGMMRAARSISTTIFIKNLPPGCTTSNLREELEPHFGSVRHVVIFQQPDNIQKTNAMVDFLELDSALAAQDELDQNFFMEKRVDVEFPLRERTKKDHNKSHVDRDKLPHHHANNRPYRKPATQSYKAAQTAKKKSKETEKEVESGVSDSSGVSSNSIRSGGVDDVNGDDSGEKDTGVGISESIQSDSKEGRD